ncbi:MAG: hypothetical protein ACYC6P_08370 [Ignavibacteriaceae bacterium]
MTQTEFDESVIYLSDPTRQTLIEVELPVNSQTRFENLYATLTNNFPLPVSTEQAPFYIWAAGANKWGVELRLYFVSDGNLPNSLNELCVNNNRHGYEQYDRRINNNDFIYDLFSRGYVLNTQIPGRIH